MAENPWTESDTARARRFWAEYQRQPDISNEIGQTAGIDPVSGRIWFGTSARDIVAQMEVEGVPTLLYFVRVGADHYLRKGRPR